MHTKRGICVDLTKDNGEISVFSALPKSDDMHFANLPSFHVRCRHETFSKWRQLSAQFVHASFGQSCVWPVALECIYFAEVERWTNVYIFSQGCFISKEILFFALNLFEKGQRKCNNADRTLFQKIKLSWSVIMAMVVLSVLGPHEMLKLRVCD